jgi:hypothetical protein
LGDDTEMPGLNQATQIAWPQGAGTAENVLDYESGVIVIPATHTSADGFDFILAAAQAPDLWNT